jgi:hypothetical protein
MTERDSGIKGVVSRTSLSSSEGDASFPWWLSTVVVLGAVLMATGALIAILRPGLLASPQDDINSAVHVYAGYLFSRNLALATMLLVALGLRQKRILNTLIVLTAFIQMLDACLDFVEGRWAIVPGVVIFGLVFFIASWRLSGYPFWRIEAWRKY